MKVISIYAAAGAFAENKDAAKELRVGEIIPRLQRGENIVLDFSRVDAATQSFVHALLSEVIRKYGPGVFERLEFNSCNIKVRKIIEIVAEYMQEGMDVEDEKSF